MQARHDRFALLVALVVVLLALGACSSDDSSDDGAAGESADTSSTDAPVDGDDGSTGGDDTSDEQDTAPPDDDSGSSGVPDGANAILEIEGERFVYQLTETGDCDPDFLGTGVFRAILGQFDENGERLVREDELRQGVTFVLFHEGSQNAGVSQIQVLSDIEWTANPDTDDRTGVDEYTIEGSRATGSATFVSSDGDGPVTGTFELVCPG